MTADALRRALFERLFLNLALVLGICQALLWQWARVVVAGGEGLSAPGLVGLAALLVAANAVAVRPVRRAFRRPDFLGRLARCYVDAGVSTLLLGVALGAVGLASMLLAGLLGAFGAGADLASRAFHAASGGAVALVAGSLAWGFSVGQARIDRTRVRIPVPGLAPGLVGLRIVQATDLHIGNRMEGARLDRMVDRINALDPDLVVLTGDLFDFDPAVVEKGARGLGRLRARHGVYAILGNHDIRTGAEIVARGLARFAPDLRLLRNEIVRLPLPDPLYLAGVEDPGNDWSARGVELPALERLAGARHDDGPTLLLAHRPELFGQAVRLDFPVVIAGHTHGGQLALPTPGGHLNLARVATPYTRGLFRSGETVMYVNRGLGVGGPALRLNCPREIATLELVNADPSNATGARFRGQSLSWLPHVRDAARAYAP
jgi:predicted MPP superfamily phosphohydrolase